MGHVVLPMGLVYPTYKIHLLNNPDLGKFWNRLNRPYIVYLDYRLWWWVSHLYTLNVRFHSNRTTTNTEPNTWEVSISFITYNIFQYCIYIYIYLYRYINIYLHFSQCFDFMILYMLWMCSRTRTHDSSSRKAILIWLSSSSSWFHGWMVSGVFSSRQSRVSCARADWPCQSVCLQICIPEKVSWKWHFKHWTSSLQPTDCPCKSMVGKWPFILTFGMA